MHSRYYNTENTTRAHGTQVIDREGNMPIHEAAQKGRDAFVELLVHAGSAVTEPNGAGLTPLDLAMSRDGRAFLEAAVAAEAAEAGEAEGEPGGEAGAGAGAGAASSDSGS